MKKIISKTNVVIMAIALFGSVCIYGVVSEDSKYAPMGYSLQMDFAGEEVPTYMADVQERLDKEMITNTELSTDQKVMNIQKSVEETTALLGTLANAGISGSKAGNNLKTAFINLNAAGIKAVFQLTI